MSSLRSRLLATTLVATVTTVGAWSQADAQTATQAGSQALPEIEVQGGSAASPNNPAAAAEARSGVVRDEILTKGAASVSTLDRQSIESLPQGDNQQFDKLLLQFPGVSQDSAASGNFHIRNEHANAQYRINGVFLPEGISGFGQFIETGFVGSVSLLTGALPAEFGLRTAGVVDITTRNGAFDNGGTFSLYGGARSTLTPSFTYGGHVGATDYFVAGRYLTDTLGIENPTPSLNAIHDRTQQGKFFGYVSTQIDDSTRLTYITGTSVDRYNIPNTPGLAPSFTAFGQSDFNSAGVNERQRESTNFNVIALQRSVDDLDLQLSYFERYSTLHFVPDIAGDLLFNGVASNVYRDSLVNGIQGDAAYRISPDNTLRFGFIGSIEQTHNANGNIALPLDPDGNPFDQPTGLFDRRSKTGATAGVYLQDEIKLTDRLTLNVGARFDQMHQYVDANQLSPRASLTYEPIDGTKLHAGYSRLFTPPEQVLSAPTNLASVNNTTLQPELGFSSPVKPERAHLFDVGWTQQIIPGFEVGVDAYYKLARDLLDDGQFGQALVLDTFNYQRAYNQGVEFKARYTDGNFSAYANVAIGKQKAKRIVSNQFLFDPDEFAYIGSHYVYTDHAQNVTASGGVSYLYRGTRFSADMIVGSGLRDGFANTGHVPAYVQVNLGLSHDFQVAPGVKPTTLRVDVVNLTDAVYQIRDGSGIGVFAPQYAPRRAILAGVTQRF